MPMEILAAISEGGQPPLIGPAILDDPLPDEMIIKLGAVGMCHTDIGISRWRHQAGVFGHEGAGTVVAVGDAVTSFALGDRVTATFGSCGTCPNCTGHRPAYCFDHVAQNFDGARPADKPALSRPDGTPLKGEFFQQSSFATHALVTQRNCVKLPDDMPFSKAAPLGCGIQTGAGAVVNNFRAKAGRPLLVIGCGAVGLSAVMAGAIIGCDPIIAVDLIPERRDMALSVGAHYALDGAVHDLAGSVRALAQGGVSYALDCAGTQATFEASLAALHPGGQCGVVTMPGEFGAPIPHPGGMAFLNTSVIGIIEGDSVPSSFIPWLIEQHKAGRLPYDKLIRTYAFSEIGTAFDDLDKGRTIKPVLVFD